MPTKPKMSKSRSPTPKKADLARARAAMRALGVVVLYGTGDGHYFRTPGPATAHNGGTTHSLITYSLD